jgi:hypothetical protein
MTPLIVVEVHSFVDCCNEFRLHREDVAVELMARYGRSAPEGIEDGAPRSVFVSAARSGS